MSSLQVGIVGLPNVGKSTLFNALVSRRQAPVGVHPFTTVKPNTGVVKVSDVRLQKLSKLIKPAKKTPTSVSFIDIAGLVKGAHKGEGLGNEFLSHIRAVDVICHVVREFDAQSVSHVMGSVEPIRDKGIVWTELLLKDLETLERAKSSRKQDPILRKTAEKLIEAIDQDKSIVEVGLEKKEREAIQHLQLLGMKPVFYVLNVSEEDLEKLKKELKELARKLDNGVVICAKLEEELTDLQEDERASYRREMGLRGSGLDRIIAKAYQLLDLITFYTVKGAGVKKGERSGEVRAWSIKRGLTVLGAAGVVHTDFEKGFINAAVANLETLLKYGGFAGAKLKGKVRSEGRDYKVKDGDVIEFLVRK